jgi:NTE family protein
MTSIDVTSHSTPRSPHAPHAPQAPHAPRSPRRRSLLHACAALIGLPWMAACAAPAFQPAAAHDTPRDALPAPAPWALVLSGGGLRGIAHVGVLRALQGLNLEPPLVVGSSIGAVIGALYASGVELDQLERLQLPAEMDPWSSLLVSPAARSASLAGLLKRTLAQQRIEHFPRRFAAVATASDTGQARAFGSGDATLAVLASAALPGALAPVSIDGREYWDGGLSLPLPVRLARSLGARCVVAVDVGFHPEVPAPRGRIGSVFHAGFLMGRNLSAPDRAAADVLIEPVLPPVPEVTLARRAALADCGERATLALGSALGHVTSEQASLDRPIPATQPPGLVGTRAQPLFYDLTN